MSTQQPEVSYPKLSGVEAQGESAETLLEPHAALIRDIGAVSQSTLSYDLRVQNVSQRAAKNHLFDGNVPLAWLFANGVIVKDPVELALTAVSEDEKFPDWLDGYVVYFVGPGLFDIEYVNRETGQLSCFTLSQWQDGLLMVHKYTFQKVGDGIGRVLYQSSLPCSMAMERLRQYAQDYSFVYDQKLHPNSLISDAIRKKKVSEKLSSEDAAVGSSGCFVSVASGEQASPESTAQEKSLFLFGAQNLVQELDDGTLKVKRLFQLGQGFGLVDQLCYDAHKEEWIFITFDFKLSGMEFTAKGTPSIRPFGKESYDICRLSTRIGVARVAVTRNFIILVLLPFKAPLNGLQVWMDNMRYYDSLHFDKDQNTQFFVISKTQRKLIAVYKSAPIYCRNIINAFEDGDLIYVDTAVYETDLIEKCYSIKNLRNAGMCPVDGNVVRRYKLSNVLVQQDLTRSMEASFSYRTNQTLEMSEVNPQFQCVDYRYAYGLGLSNSESKIYDMIVKADLAEKVVANWQKDGCCPSKPVFIPNPTGAQEDDGVLVSILFDFRVKQSRLVVIKAQNMKTVSLGQMQNPIPFVRSSVFALSSLNS
ncbi:hypothetical protein MIR68_001671 [Amoeboaphelidium protococcarum]|nr:hypothetical protein MIR68_001671 [Amoeboaphelidium protococcarum]